MWRNRTVVLVALTSLFTDISSEMVYPLLPLFVTGTLGASRTALGLIEGVAESIAQLLRVFSGIWSDRLGRRQALAAGGYAGSAVGKLLLFVAGSWLWVFGARVIDRLGKAVRSAPRDALIADAVPASERGRAYGFHRAMDTLGALVGILLAYFILGRAGAEIRQVLLIAVIPALLGVLCIGAVRDVRPAAAAQRPPERFRPLVAWAALPPRLKAYLAVVLLFTIGNSSNQFLVLRAAGLGFDTRSVLLLYLAYNVVYLLASYPAGKLSDRIGRRALLVGGYAAYGGTYLGLALVGELPAAGATIAVWGLFAAYGLHLGLTEGVEKALLVDLAPRQLRATVLGLNATVIGLALLPASLIAGLLWDSVGASAPFYVGAAAGLLAAVAMRKLL